MENKLRAHVDLLFEDVPNTRKALELREEMVQNLQEKYYDLLAEGRSEDAAFNIAVAGIGDVTELISGLDEELSSVTTDYQKERQRSALFVSAAVMLYILALIPLYMTMEFWYLGEAVGVILTVIMIAAATGLLIYNQLTKKYTKMPKKTLTIADELQHRMTRAEDRRKIRAAVSIALWTVIIVAYFLISFLFRVWAVSWVLFLIGGAAEALITIYFMLKK